MTGRWIETMMWLILPAAWVSPVVAEGGAAAATAVVPVADAAPRHEAPIGCGRSVTLERMTDGVVLWRTIGTDRRTLRAATRVDAVSDLVHSGGRAHVAVTRDDGGIRTEVWIAQCFATSDVVAVHVVPHALMHPHLLAAARAVYLIDGLPWGGEEFRSPVRRVPGVGESGFERLFPCRDGYRPVTLALAPDGETVRVGCWHGGNAPDGSYEVDL